VRADKQNDIALVRIGDESIPPLLFRDDRRIRLGESIFALGFPLQGVTASSLNLTTGTVSALAGLGDDIRVLQFTAPIQPGSSGGPLLDRAGSVVGVVVSKLSPIWTVTALGDIPQNVNFAIRGSVVRAFLDSLGVMYGTAQLGTQIAPTDIAEGLGRSVVAVECIGQPSANLIEHKADRTSPEISVGRATSIHIRLEAGNPALRTEITKELLKWGQLTVVSAPEAGDLVLVVVQTGFLDLNRGTGNQAGAVLKDSRSGIEVWSTTKGGGSVMAGFSNAWVGRAIAKDLIKIP
jgi:hypothetical protein